MRPSKLWLFLWLLAMVAGLGLMIWLMPPSEIEARLKEQSRKQGANQP
jgi:hypothetical protein